MTKQNNEEWHLIEETLNQIVEQQQKELLKCGRRIIPNLTTEDILQPNDYIQLENNPHFRFEEGVLAGIQTVHMALIALRKDSISSK
jgi:hypothetical protein